MIIEVASSAKLYLKLLLFSKLAQQNKLAYY